MITISLCMIVKNEEKVLKRCLDGIADLMDEIIIVDTGSSDATKKIAAAYTDQIYDFAWNGSFADARNFAFSKAGKEYIYCADADEVMDAENHEKFRQLKEVLLPEIDIVQMHYTNQLAFSTIYNYDDELRPKLYKRLRTFRWEGIIHEAVTLEPVVYDSEIAIIHRPEGEHTARDIAAFERLWKSGQEIDRRLRGIYARELFISGSDADIINSLPFFEMAADDASCTQEDLLEIFAVLTRGYHKKGDVTQMFTAALKAVAAGSCAEVCLELGLFYREQGNDREAAVWLYNAARETQCILDVRCTERAEKLGGFSDRT